MKDPLSYTYDGIERELNLLEIHLKEAPEGDEVFCKDCIDKHISTIRGYAIEGPGFTDDKEEQGRFLNVEKQLRKMKGRDYKKHGVEYAQKVRELRKSLREECSNCKTLSESEIENLSKGLNSSDSFDILADGNHTHNSSDAELNTNKDNMGKIDFTQLGYMSAGQFAAEGGRYLAETYPSTEPGKYEKYATIGGGAILAILPAFIKLPKVVKTISMVAGTNLLAGGVVKWIKEGTAPVVGLRARGAVALNGANGVGGYAGKMGAGYAPAYGGPVFKGKVTAKNIPSQYTRASILSGAQAFGEPSHADLIRVD